MTKFFVVIKKSHHQSTPFYSLSLVYQKNPDRDFLPLPCLCIAFSKGRTRQSRVQPQTIFYLSNLFNAGEILATKTSKTTSNSPFSMSNWSLPMSNPSLPMSNPSLAMSNQSLPPSNPPLAMSNQSLSMSNRSLAMSNQSLPKSIKSQCSSNQFPSPSFPNFSSHR